jgi:hypothetical protein
MKGQDGCSVVSKLQRHLCLTAKCPVLIPLVGMACRMIPDLGLDRKMEAPSLAVDDNSIPSEPNLFYMLLCAIVTFEGIWCLYLGRRTSIPRSVTKVAVEQSKKTQVPSTQMAVAWVTFSVLLAEINDLLNNGSLSTPTTRNRLSALDHELSRWNDSLPQGVSLKDGKIMDLDATAYGLQGTYCKIRILLHQASIPSDAQKPGIYQTHITKEHELLAPESSKIIYDNAVLLAQLFVTYRQLFGTEKLAGIMLDNANMSATCLINHLLCQPTEDATTRDTKKWLRSTIDTLEAVEQHFPVTKRMVVMLKQRLKNTHLASLFDSSIPDATGTSRSSTVSQPKTDAQLESLPMQPGREDFEVGPWQNSPAVDIPISHLFPDMNRDDQGMTQYEIVEQPWPQGANTDFAVSGLSWPGMHFMSSFRPPDGM